MTKKKTATVELPFHPEAEQSVLGAILVRPELLDDVVDILEPADFYNVPHANIYRAMLGLYNSDQPVDLVSVTLRLKEVGLLDAAGGPVFLSELSEQVGFAVNVGHYAGIVKQKSLLRRMIQTSQEIITECSGSVEDAYALIDAAEEKVLAVRESQKEKQEAVTLSTVIPAEVERLERIYQRDADVLGVSSGFRKLDAITSGWQKSDLIIIAARPSMGKTAMAIGMGNYAASHGTPTLFFSLEQPKEQVAQRLLAGGASINSSRLRSAKLNMEQWAQLNAAAGELMDTRLFIADRPALNMVEIRALSKRMVKRHGVGLILLDYLQLVRERARSREQEIGGVSRGLKALAKELNVPVIALAQLNRDVEKRPNKRPMLSDLRESGSIEQDADVVLFIYRDEVYRGENSPDQGIAEIRVAKQRNGPTGKLKLAYLKEYVRFENLAETEEE